MRPLIIKLIHLYRYIASPWVGNQCRFHPTCSHYAEEAINQYGVIKGGYLMLRRLIKCHPWHPGGFDYVPENRAPENKLSSTHQDISDKVSLNDCSLIERHPNHEHKHGCK